MQLRSFIVLTASTAAAFALLVGLGVWQLQRLHWKEGLLEQIEARTKAQPISLDEAIRRANSGDDINYLRVTATGSFDHAHERYLFATADGEVGWHVITPLDTASGEAELVDRGFVPDALRDQASRREGNSPGAVTVTGLARPAERVGMFTPNNQPDANRWFSRDLAGMAASIGREGKIAPFFLEAERGANPASWPRGGQTRLDIPNDHLQYAITWFLLAAALLVIYGVYLRSRLKDEKDGRIAR